ncbi:MAG: FemAB family PEP-CTERM system-associated protein [Magnetococcales bacterium]|nr:FemAB family PEP-CTERM system-associated protein [Magnetococcales bacterium]
MSTVAKSPGSVHVRPLGGEADGLLWDKFVMSCPNATFFHREGWRRVIETSFSHKAHYLLAEEDGEIAGVLPLVRQRSLLFGDALISTPFCVYGGVATSRDDVRIALELQAAAMADSMGVAYLECRNRASSNPNWPTKDLYCGFSKAIWDNPQENLLAIPRKQRAEVRRGLKNGLVGELDQDVGGICYDIYSQSVRNLGTPVFARDYFKILKSVFGKDCDGFVVRQEGRAVAAVVNFYFRDEVLPYYGGGIAEARSLGATHFMYWDLMSHASRERGVKIFDFGRSKRGSGSFAFKQYYGFTPEPLLYQYHLVGQNSIPDLSPNNPKYRLFINMWKRLPLSVSQFIGPWIAKNLG